MTAAAPPVAPTTGIDLIAANRFLNAIAGVPNAVFVWQLLPEKDPTREDHKRHFAGTLKEKSGAASRFAEDGALVCIQVNPGPRSNKEIRYGRAAFVDNDDPTKTLDVSALAPSIIVESSTGKQHFYWLLDQSAPIAQWIQLQTALAVHFGTDPSMATPNRVMRLPGSYNWKSGEKTRVKLLECHPERRYSVEQVIKAFNLSPEPVSASLPRREALPEPTTPDNVVVLPGTLEKADTAKEKKAKVTPAAKAAISKVRMWLDGKGIKYTVPANEPVVVKLLECPFNATHKDMSIRALDNGALWAGCFHAHCGSNTQIWDKVREKIGGYGARPDGEARYVVRDGRTCVVERRTAPDGQLIVTYRAIADFSARIVDQQVHNDGSGVLRRRYLIEGTRADGSPLPGVIVAAEKFDAMQWIGEAWGSAAVIYAAKGARDQMRDAIMSSSHPTVTHVYTHTGIARIGDRWVYLHAAGALGADGVSVELPGTLGRYEFPPEVVDAREAIGRLLALIDLAPRAVTIPLVAAAMIAPLASILHPDFVVWLRAGTGSRKSELAALVLNLLGAAWSRKAMPLDFSSTAAAIEHFLFRAKDVLTVVDDFLPARSPQEQRATDGKAQALIHGVGNRSGRSRMTSSLEARPVLPPRGMVIGTAEALPPGHSTVARLLVVEVRNVDDARLTVAQQHRGRLAHAGRRYVEWLLPQYDQLAETLPRRYTALCQELRSQGGAHHRSPDQLGYILLGIQLLGEFAVAEGVLDEKGAAELNASAREAIGVLARAQVEAVVDADPVEKFLGALRTMLAMGKARLAPRDLAVDALVVDTGELIGWRDATTAYLLTDAAIGLVSRHCAARNDHFAPSVRSLHEALAHACLLVRTDAGRHDLQIRLGGAKRRVAAIPLRLLLDESSDETKE